MQHSVRPTSQMMLGALLTVCVFGAGVVFSWLVRKLSRKAWPPRWLAVSVRAGIVLVAAAGMLGLIYGFYVEPHWLAVERVRVESTKLPSGMDPIRIVHISDFHSEGDVRCEDDLPGIIARQHPHLIVYTGDAVNGADGIPVFNRCMRRITILAPTFVIHAGNDPAYLGRGLFRNTGVIDVTRNVKTIRIAGVEICVGGIASGGRIPRGLRSASPAALKILLCHYPSHGAKAVKDSDVDLCFAGNTHGGQVRLPLYGSATGSKADRKYVAGLFRVGKCWLYVNRGLGMSGASFPVRFGARPEVTIMEASPAQ